MLWREKKLGEICHIVARKLPSLTNRGAPMNTSNWFLNKIKITDSKLNHAHINYIIRKQVKLSHCHIRLTNSRATFWSLVTVVENYLSANPKLKAGLQISLYNKAFQFLFVKKQSWPKSKLLVKNQKPKSSMKSNYTEIKIRGDSGTA